MTQNTHVDSSCGESLEDVFSDEQAAAIEAYVEDNYVPREKYEEERERREEAERERDELRDRVEDLEGEIERVRDRADRKVHNVRETLFSLVDCVRELQSREFEKGGHLYEGNVEPTEIEIENGQLEKLTKDDGRQYYRAFGEVQDDPFDEDNISCSYDDLLPVQQLARLKDDMLAEQPTTDERATWAWRNREDWFTSGCNGVKEYIDASDLATELYLKDDRIGSRESAQAIAGKVMHRLRELSKDRVRVESRDKRKGGIPCTEKRLIVPEEAEIPGDTPTPRTDDGPANAVVSGD